jgi:uncharacterized membrane protein
MIFFIKHKTYVLVIPFILAVIGIVMVVFSLSRKKKYI